MKFFIDTAEIKEIKEAAAMGLVDGCTTNPSLVAKSGRKFREVLLEICDIVKGPVSAEVVSVTHDEIMKEARELAALRNNIIVKIPLIPEGLKAVRTCTSEGIKTNVTLNFSPLQPHFRSWRSDTPAQLEHASCRFVRWSGSARCPMPAST